MHHTQHRVEDLCDWISAWKFRHPTPFPPPLSLLGEGMGKDRLRVFSLVAWKGLANNTAMSRSQPPANHGGVFNSGNTYYCRNGKCPALLYIVFSNVKQAGQNDIFNQCFGSGSFCPDPDQTFFLPDPDRQKYPDPIRTGSTPDPWKNRPKIVSSSKKKYLALSILSFLVRFLKT